MMKLTSLWLIRSDDGVGHPVVKSLQTLSRRHQRHCHLDWPHVLHLPVVIGGKSENARKVTNYASNQQHAWQRSYEIDRNGIWGSFLMSHRATLLV